MALPHTVAIIGAGTMGRGIAQSFAQAGFTVQLHDNSPDVLQHARTQIGHGLDRFVEKKTIAPADRDAAFERLTLHPMLEDCVRADLIIEAIVEDANAKRDLLRRLDAMCRPDVVFASNTSSVSIASLAVATSRADRVIGLHFMNPVPLMPLVEVVRGHQTSPATLQLAHDLCDRLGKTAIEAADTPGFIANRILMPMINEAVQALDDRVGTAEAIDGVMTIGMKHPMGPLALADLIGLDVCVAILEVMHTGLGDSKYRAAPLLLRMVAAGQLGRKTRHGFYRY